jgi:hypothetical protein
MSVSGVTTFTMTATQIVDRAFNVLGVGSEGESLTARMYTDGIENLNLLIKTWGAQDHLWIRTERTLTLIASQAAYDVSAGGTKPMRVTSVRRVYQGTETPLNEMARQTYFDQPNKALSASTPVSFYYDPQQSTGTLYLWPAPDASFVSNQTINYTCLRRMSDIVSPNDEIDMPQEWLQTVIWNLANDLETQYPVNDGRLAVKIERRALQLYTALKGFDNEPASVFLQPDYEGMMWR